MTLGRSKKKLGNKNIPLRWGFDLAVRIILGSTFAFCAGIYALNAYHQFNGLTGPQLDVAHVTQGLMVCSNALYSLLVACLYITRLKPVNKFAGWWPSIAAVLGGFLSFGILVFKPQMIVPLPVQIGATLVVFVATAGVIYVLSQLGRSFSILPESRKLVTTGPYRFVRHPLYLAEAIASLGTLVGFLSVGAVALVVTQLAFQLVRMHYEERVLRASFPDYAKYAKKTARLIPGIY